MKLLLYLIAVASIFFAGCEDTFIVKNYYKPQEFYKQVNSKVNDCISKVVTIDTTYTAEDMIIRSDSIYLLVQVQKTKLGNTTVFSKADIKDIEYKKFIPEGVANIALITLKSGETILAKNVSGGQDSITISSQIPQFYTVKNQITLPASDVKTISYNNHWIGLAEGAGIGIISGILIGIQSNASLPTPQMGGGPEGGLIIAGTIILGTLAGSVVGAIVGSEQTIIINDQKSYMGIISKGIIWGTNTSGLNMTFNGLNGVNSDNIVNYKFGGYIAWAFNKFIGLRTELTYGEKGGSFHTDNGGRINRTVYFDDLEIPIMPQIAFYDIYFKPRFYGGPVFSFFIKGRYDEEIIDKYSGFPSGTISIPLSASNVHSPDFGYLIGFGINLQKKTFKTCLTNPKDRGNQGTIFFQKKVFLGIIF